MDERRTYKGFWNYMAKYLTGYKKDIIRTAVFSLIVGVCVACQPLVIKYIVDDGISNPHLDSDEKMSFVAVLCGVYMFFGILRMITWKTALKSMLKALEGSIFRLRSEFFSHVQHMCMKFYDKTSAGELFNCIMGSPIVNMKTYMQQVFINTPYQAVTFAISLVALTSYDIYLTIIMLLTAFLMALVNILSRKKIKEAFSDYIKTETEASHYLNDTLHGMDAVKLHSIEDYSFKTFQRFIASMFEKSSHAVITQEVEAQKPQFFTFLGTCTIYIVGALFCIRGRISVGELYAFISSMGTILSLLTTWLTVGLMKNSAQVGLYKILSILDTQSSTPDSPTGYKRNVDVERANAKKNNKPCIEFQNVTFGYDNKNIFNGLNCNIKYNESIALVGSSGSGKSTFIKLPIRLYDVCGGTVKIHGQDIRDFDIHDLRVSFGIVPQNPFIFSGTIWENITLAHPEASSLDVINAMEIAHVHEFVNELPDGWATRVGDGALNLSGGQKQRIAIARAILGNPDVLIFDEATSALDNISEHHIQEAMEELMKTHTVIIVAHRLSTIRNVDRIMVFDRGNIVQEGNFIELQNQEGLFKELLDAAQTNN